MGAKTFCPICEEEVPVEAFKEVYVSPYNNEEYKRYECPNCEVHWWEPLKIIPEFYESEVFEAYIAFHEGLRELPEWCKPFFQFFLNHIKGKLLDIGCGDGVFLKYAKESGFEVWGIDFDKNSVEVAKKSLGVDTIFAMSLEEFYAYAKKNDLKFDVITFFEVLEHQDKPKEFLTMVKELLKDGGYIAGSVPNRDRLFHEMEWKYFHVDFPPHHFLRFSKSSLEKTLQLSGFSDVVVYELDFPFREIFPYIEKKLFGNRLDSLKVKLKAWIVGSERKAKAYAAEELSKVGSKGYAVRILENLRNLCFTTLCYFLHW